MSTETSCHLFIWCKFKKISSVWFYTIFFNILIHVYYILNKEIQEFLNKNTISQSLEIFVSSRDNWAPAFGLLWILLCLQLQLNTSLKLARVAFIDCKWKNRCCGVFQEYRTDFLWKSVISCGMASPHIIDASDFAIRNVSLAQIKADYPLWT